MQISVIVPTYKPQDYLWMCLSSLVNQTMDKKDFEVIIVLNGCKIPYETQIQDFISAKMGNMHVKLVQTNESGVSNARNLGIESARGEYIMFLDDDDWLSTSALDDMRKMVMTDSVVCCDVKCVHPITKEMSTDYLHDSYVRNCRLHATLWSARSYFSTSCCKLLPKQIISTTRFDPRFAIGEDSLFMTEIAHRTQSIRFAPPSAVYFRRLSPDSASRRKRSVSWRMWQCARLNLAFLCAWIRHPLIDPRFPLSRIVTTFINMLNISIKR